MDLVLIKRNVYMKDIIWNGDGNLSIFFGNVFRYRNNSRFMLYGHRHCYILCTIMVRNNIETVLGVLVARCCLVSSSLEDDHTPLGLGTW